MRWLIHDLFVEQPPGSPHHYWLLCGEQQQIPEYINSLYSNIKAIESIDPSDWDSQNYLGGLKIDSSHSKCCIFRLYPGGRDSKGRSGRWVMLALEITISSLDLLKVLELESFKDYEVGSAASATMPERFPRIPRETPLLTPLQLPESAELSADQLRGISLSMTSGRGSGGLLLIKKSNDKLKGYYRKTPDALRSKKQPQVSKPASVMPSPQSPSTGKGRIRKLAADIIRRRSTQLIIGALFFFFLGYFAARMQPGHVDFAESPDQDPSAPIIIDGPPTGSTVTVYVTGGRDFSFMATNAKSTKFELHQLGRTSRRPTGPVEVQSNTDVDQIKEP